MPRSLRIILFCIGLSLVVGFAASWIFSETNYYYPHANGPVKVSQAASDDDSVFEEQDFNVQIGLAVGGIALGASFLVAALVFRKPTS